MCGVRHGVRRTGLAANQEIQGALTTRMCEPCVTRRLAYVV